MRSTCQNRSALSFAAALTLLLSAGAPPVEAQESSAEWLDRCREANGSRATHCEVREISFAAPARLQVNARPNGGIDARGVDGSEVRVSARVRTWAATEAAAAALAEEIRVEAAGGTVEAHGPSIRGSRDRGWSVSYVVAAPRRIDLELGSTNGGLSVRDIDGELSLTTTNGGISLNRVGGSVRARTTNGAIDAELAGERWNGDLLDVQTTNGSIDVAVPGTFSADLSASTVNGGISTDFDLTVRGRISRSISGRIGAGGPPVRLATTNGAIALRRR